MSARMAELFRRLSSGVYVVGVATAAQRDAFTASSIAQASYEPLMISMAVNRAHGAFALLCQAEAFALSVLGADRTDLAAHFGRPAARGVDKLQGCAWFPGHQGAPILSCGIAYFDCTICEMLSAGDHEVVLGKVIDGAIIDAASAPLLYAGTGDLDGSSKLFPDRFSAL